MSQQAKRRKHDASSSPTAVVEAASQQAKRQKHDASSTSNALSISGKQFVPKWKTLIVFYDTETTSNDPTKHRIISMGAVCCECKNGRFVPLGRFHSLVHTDQQIDDVAYRIHHISQKDLQGQPEFSEVMTAFSSFLKTYIEDQRTRIILVAHNGRRFDDIILLCEFIRNNMNIDEWMQDNQIYALADTLPLLKKVFKHVPMHQKPKNVHTGAVSFALGNCFDSLCQDSDNVFENRHDALADSLALMHVLNSPAVTQRFHFDMLLKEAQKRTDALKRMRESAGVKFQEQETRCLKLMAEAGNMTLDDVKQDTEEELLPRPEFAEAVQENLALCLVCMNMVRPDNHQCHDVPVALQHRLQSSAALDLSL